MHDNGYVKISDLLDWLRSQGHAVTESIVFDIVKNDRKGRYSVQEGMIRANQGHSSKVVIEMKEYTGHGPLLHGTYQKHKESILKTGLNRGTRQHIHMMAINSSWDWGMLRKSIDMYVLIDVESARRDGHKFLVSDNNVVLTEGPLDPKYLTLTPAHYSGCMGMIIYDESDPQRVVAVKTHKGHYGFPKGKRSKKETPLCCAYREVQEETGIRPDQLTLTGEVRDEVHNDRVVTSYYIATCKGDIDVGPEDPEELACAEWLTLDAINCSCSFATRRKVLLGLD